MLKSFLRAAANGRRPENDLGIPEDMMPVSEAALSYEKDHETDLINSFENCLYAPGLKNDAPPEDDTRDWSQKTMAEIHQQLLLAFMRGMVSYGIELEDVSVDNQPDEDPDSDNGGIIILSRAGEMLRTPDEMIAARLYDYVMELQDCAEENYDQEDRGGTLFEVLPGTEDVYLTIRYDYEAFYNALNMLAPRLKDTYEVDAFLNSAYHVMDRYDAGVPPLRLN